MRVAAGVLGFLFVLVLAAFPVTFMTAPEEDRFSLVVVVLVAALVLGLPAYGAVRFVQNPPHDALELGPAGIRRVGGRLDWEVSWWQLRGIAVSFERLGFWRRRRRVRLVLAPADGATVEFPGALPWTGRAGYTVGMRISDDRFSNSDPVPVQQLDEALRTLVPHLYEGILRD